MQSSVRPPAPASISHTLGRLEKAHFALILQVQERGGLFPALHFSSLNINQICILALGS